MKKFLIVFLSLAFAGSFGGWNPCPAQTTRGSSAVAFLAQRLGEYLESTEREYRLVRQGCEHYSPTHSYVEEIFETDEYQVRVEMIFLDSPEHASEVMGRLSVSLPHVGKPIIGLGDEACFWSNGMAHLRQGNIVVVIEADANYQLENIGDPTSSETAPQSDEVFVNTSHSAKSDIVKRFLLNTAHVLKLNQ